jgi:predicted small lipoprotein YifL
MQFELKSSVAACCRGLAGALVPQLFLAMSLSLLAGCGQKGPLTLPKAAAAAPSSASAPAPAP